MQVYHHLWKNLKYKVLIAIYRGNKPDYHNLNINLK